MDSSAMTDYLLTAISIITMKLLRTWSYSGPVSSRKTFTELVIHGEFHILLIT